MSMCFLLFWRGVKVGGGVWGKTEIQPLKNLNYQILLWKKEDCKELSSSGMRCFTVKLLKLMSLSLFASLLHVFWHLWQFPSSLRIIFHLRDAPGIFYQCCRSAVYVFIAWLWKRGAYNRLRSQAAIISLLAMLCLILFCTSNKYTGGQGKWAV